MNALAAVALTVLSSGCAVNAAAGGPVPIRAHGPTVYASPGAHLVTGLDEPVFLVDGNYWLWEHGRWHVWRSVGWQPTPPPAPLQDLDDTLATRTFFMSEP